jgi:hypothetical protein
MAIKFSQFVVKTIQSDVDFIVGYKGTDNVQITPSDFLSASLGAYLPLAGGTMTGDIILNDDVRLRAGTGSDFSFFHNGSNSKINNNTGNIEIENFQDDGDIIFKSDDGTGSTTEYFRVDGGQEKTSFIKNTEHQDSVKAQFGDSGDFGIFHNGTNSFLENDTGDLYIRNNADDKDIIFQSDDGSGGVATYMTIDGGNVRTQIDREMRFMDTIQAKFGTGGDLILRHNATDSYIENSTGDLLITNNANDKDIKFSSDDGSGGVTEYFRVDGDNEHVVYSKPTIFSDNVKLKFGDGIDLEIYHNSTTNANEIASKNNRQLQLKQDNLFIGNQAGTETIISAVADSAVELYYDNSKKFETTSTGIDVTGTTDTDNLTIAGAQGSAGEVLTSTGSGVAWQAGGGGGATSLNDLTDVLIDGTSSYFVNIPAGLSGNPEDNIVIGSLAGNALTTGTRHTIIGHDAASTITTCNSNTVYGYEAGKSLATTADRNVIIGDMACRAGGGDDNVSIGSSAGANWGFGVEDSVAIGSFASGVSGGAVK